MYARISACHVALDTAAFFSDLPTVLPAACKHRHNQYWHAGLFRAITMIGADCAKIAPYLLGDPPALDAVEPLPP